MPRAESPWRTRARAAILAALAEGRAAGVAGRDLERLVAERVAGGMDRAEAEELERASIGYYAGYTSRATFDRVTRLFGATHPIFGNAWPTSPEEALAMALAHFERNRSEASR